MRAEALPDGKVFTLLTNNEWTMIKKTLVAIRANFARVTEVLGQDNYVYDLDHDQALWTLDAVISDLSLIHI